MNEKKNLCIVISSQIYFHSISNDFKWGRLTISISPSASYQSSSPFLDPCNINVISNVFHWQTMANKLKLKLKKSRLSYSTKQVEIHIYKLLNLCSEPTLEHFYELWVKVTVHLEWCFQFFICNFVNMHRLPTNLYIDGKLVKLSRW